MYIAELKKAFEIKMYRNLSRSCLIVIYINRFEHSVYLVA